MNDAQLHDTLARLQSIFQADTGLRLGPEAELAIGKILRNVASGNLSGAEGLAAREVTILLADLRGFTFISANHPAGTVFSLINRCLITMSEVVFRHQGTIDKFMGDSIMVVFGGRSSSVDAMRAVHCAVDLQLAMDELNEHYRQFGLPDLFLGIGINTGPVLAGTLGSNLYAAHTVIGDEVNLAARIEAFSLRGQILISQATFDRCEGLVTTGEPLEVQLKGKGETITVREVLDIPSFGKTVPRREIRRSPRVNMRTPFTYRLIERDVTLPEELSGTVLDIGYHGILAEIAAPCTPLSELKLEMDLPLVGARATDVYARTLKIARSKNGFLCGMEFTSLSTETARNIRLLVQQLMQGSEPR